MLPAIEAAVLEEGPDVLVFGDTNSTLAGALAAGKLLVPVAHVEAGLRSFDRTMPEELNRMLVDRMSSLLFCPTDVAVGNLAAEGIGEGVHLVGDVMYDANRRLAPIARDRSDALARNDVDPGATSCSRSTARPTSRRSRSPASPRRSPPWTSRWSSRRTPDELDPDAGRHRAPTQRRRDPAGRLPRLRMRSPRKPGSCSPTPAASRGPTGTASPA